MDFINENLVYVAGIVALLAIFALVWVIFLSVRLRKLFRGGKSENLEEVLVEIKKEIFALKMSNQEIEKYLESSEPRLKKSIKHVGIIRFNSFSDVGGNQSFAIAILDENKKGAVISSLYGRDASRIYAKPIEGGVSTYTLSEEEKEAITKAVNNLN